ncbi:C6 transcription factor [Colletotrichum truncatum]|uniref:C6 transcription factor n=1 Tax=Colletotrichum truncatum TaxID=5467 RepID=A0ACC3Z072_COLTU|nr:C6 transcription factor [Colletotrichum truncatum]KAF6800742.1 C6 transcription factor [Colletotrichum truncatum]
MKVKCNHYVAVLAKEEELRATESLRFLQSRFYGSIHKGHMVVSRRQHGARLFTVLQNYCCVAEDIQQPVHHCCVLAREHKEVSSDDELVRWGESLLSPEDQDTFEGLIELFTKDYSAPCRSGGPPTPRRPQIMYKIYCEENLGFIRENTNAVVPLPLLATAEFKTIIQVSRKSMSSALVADVPSTVTAALNRIEENTRGPELRIPTDFAVGPFGVFKSVPSCNQSSFGDDTLMLSPPPTTCRSGSIEVASYSSPLSIISSSIPQCQNRIQAQREGTGLDSTSYQQPIENDVIIPDALGDFFSNSLDFLQWGDLFTWDSELLGIPLLANNLNCIDAPTEPSGCAADCDTTWTDMAQDSLLVHSSTGDVAWPELNLEVDAPLLLKHFNEEVINQMGSLPINEKSGWRILNVPHAILTLIDLTMFKVGKEKIRHASLANFYALIAVSAFHLSLNAASFPSLSKPGRNWEALSKKTYDAAKYHLKISLETESTLESSNKAKYKEQLMAVGAVLATSLLSGNELDSHRYLVAMERLIRRRGLKKPKLSRRARLFHNIYAWMRIVSESTNVLHENSPFAMRPFKLVRTGLTTPEDNDSGTIRSKQATPLNIQNTNTDSTLDSFLHLESPYLQPYRHDRDQDHDDTRDIHLMSSLNCQEDMHMRIYGVPETWLRLVSQTTRLANVMDHLATGQDQSDGDNTAFLQSKASYLEEAVCSFKMRYLSNTGAETNQSRPHVHMTRALSAALVIFFYRRIRKIHTLMLQESVKQVIESLHAFDKALEENELLGPGTAWPAFVAGAEATESEQRRQFEDWLVKAHSKSGWKGYLVSKEILNEVWMQRDAAGGTATSPTWVDVCKQMRRWPLLC